MLKISKNLTLRLLSAFILIVITYSCLYRCYQPIPKLFFISLLIISALEWSLLIKRWFYNYVKYLIWLACGFSYICLGFYGMYCLYTTSIKLFTYILISIFLSDSAAYFIGRAIKGPKLAPKISPGKTWSGAIGAYSMVILYALILAQFNYITTSSMILIIALCPIGQAGDLLESFIKRQLKVKDSSQFIPGHGGILDRLDSILLVGLVLVFL